MIFCILQLADLTAGNFSKLIAQFVWVQYTPRCEKQRSADRDKERERKRHTKEKGCIAQKWMKTNHIYLPR